VSLELVYLMRLDFMSRHSRQSFARQALAIFSCVVLLYVASGVAFLHHHANRPHAILQSACSVKRLIGNCFFGALMLSGVVAGKKQWRERRGSNLVGRIRAKAYSADSWADLP